MTSRATINTLLFHSTATIGVCSQLLASCLLPFNGLLLQWFPRPRPSRATLELNQLHVLKAAAIRSETSSGLPRIQSSAVSCPRCFTQLFFCSAQSPSWHSQEQYKADRLRIGGPTVRINEKEQRQGNVSKLQNANQQLDLPSRALFQVARLLGAELANAHFVGRRDLGLARGCAGGG